MLADSWSWMGKLKEAEQEYLKIIVLLEKVRGPDHPETLKRYHNLARLLYNMNKRQEALDYSRRAYLGRLKVFGKNHPLTIAARQQMDTISKSTQR